MFDSLVDFLKTNIDELNGHEVQISSEFKEHHNEDSKYIIKNWLFSSPEYRKWRITRLDGGKKLQVFNTVAYPTFDIEMPILGADILWFGTSQKLLAILDYQPLIQEGKYLEKYCSSLGTIKEKYSAFDNMKKIEVGGSTADRNLLYSYKGNFGKQVNVPVPGEDPYVKDNVCRIREGKVRNYLNTLSKEDVNFIEIAKEFGKNGHDLYKEYHSKVTAISSMVNQLGEDDS